MTTYHAHPSPNNTTILTTPAGAFVLEVPQMAFGQQQMKLVSGYQTGSAPVLTYELVLVRWHVADWQEKTAELRRLAAELQTQIDSLTARGPLKNKELSISATWRKSCNKRLRDAHQGDLCRMEAALRNLQAILSSLIPTI